jgi:hypothetical protein
MIVDWLSPWETMGCSVDSKLDARFGIDAYVGSSGRVFPVK